MSARPALLLLATSFLTLSIAGSAWADSPTATPPANPTVIDEIRAEKPGALEAFQLQVIQQMLSEGVRAYQRQTGQLPATAQTLLDAGCLPLRAVAHDGSPIPIVALQNQELPGIREIGLRVRSTDCTLMRMGADGDPLAPIVLSVNVNVDNDTVWHHPYPWTGRLAAMLELGLVRLCGSYVTLTGALPASAEALQSTFGLTPVGAVWQTSGVPPTCGVMLEIESTGKYLRTTRYPDPGYGQVSTYELVNHTTWMQCDPQTWVQTIPLAWQSIGTLSYSAAFPATLSTWTAPPIVVDRPDAQAAWTLPNRMPVLLHDFSFAANWYLEQQGTPPTIEWLLANVDPIHEALDAQLEPLPFSPATRDPKIRVITDTPAAEPPAVSLWLAPQASSDGQPMHMLYLQANSRPQHLTDRYPEPKLADMIDNTGQSLSTHIRPSQRQMLSGWQRPPPTLESIATAREWLINAPVSQQAAVSDWIWTAEEMQPASYPQVWAFSVSQTLLDAYDQWLVINPHSPLPTDWNSLLLDLGLQASGYVVLPPGADAPADQLRCELATDSDYSMVRISLRLPNGDSTMWYATSPFLDDLMRGFNQAIVCKYRPEVATLDYLPIATFAIPIPDPPVIPEVSAP